MDEQQWGDRLGMVFTSDLTHEAADDAAALIRERMTIALSPSAWADDPSPAPDNVKMWSLADPETGHLYVDVEVRLPPDPQWIDITFTGPEGDD